MEDISLECSWLENGGWSNRSSVSGVPVTPFFIAVFSLDLRWKNK